MNKGVASDGAAPFFMHDPLPPRKIGFLSPYPARPYPARFATKLETGGVVPCATLRGVPMQR